MMVVWPIVVVIIIIVVDTAKNIYTTMTPNMSGLLAHVDLSSLISPVAGGWTVVQAEQIAPRAVGFGGDLCYQYNRWRNDMNELYVGARLRRSKKSEKRIHKPTTSAQLSNVIRDGRC